MATNVTYFTNGAEIIISHSYSRTSAVDRVVSIGDYHFGIVEWQSAGRPESTIMFGSQSVNVPFDAASFVIFSLALCALIVTAAFVYRAQQRRVMSARNR